MRASKARSAQYPMVALQAHDLTPFHPFPPPTGANPKLIKPARFYLACAL